MVILLTPEIIKDETQKGKSEQHARMRDMALEEERLVKSINDLRVADIEERERITKELDAFRAQKSAEKTALSAEVSELENRRKAALTPIEDVLANARAIEASAIAREQAVEKRETEQKQGEELLAERLEALDDEKDANNEKSEVLASREQAINQEQARSKESAESIAASWVDLHAATTSFNAMVAKEKAEIAAGKKANDEFKQTLDLKEAEQRRKDLEIADKYATLESARKEILEGKLM